MKIQFNTDHNIKGSNQLTNPLEYAIAEGLNRFSNHISQITVHLTDTNGNKEGPDDKRCLLEARLEGINPLVVTNNANTYEDAVKGAINKMKTSLDTTLGKIESNNRDK